MYKRLSAVMFPIMTILLIAAVVWGYQQNQQKNSVLIKAENQYQRAFHDLNYHIERLHSELGNTLAVNSASTSTQRKSLVNVWRMTSEAQNEINQLPLALLPFNKTEEFLSKIANFSYKTSIRDLTKQPLSKEEVQTLKTLYKNSEEIAKDLQGVQGKVIVNQLRWTDVESAMADGNTMADNSIIDGFKTVDKKVGEYPELDFGPSVMSMYDKRSVKKLTGLSAKPEEIKEKAAQFTGVNNTDAIHVTENGKNTEWASYTATVAGRNPDEPISMDFTEKGGHLISYSDARQVGEKQVSMTQARAKADQFLREKGYENMEAVAANEFGNTGNFTYVTKQGDVLVYPEKMTVRVGLDNGDVTGFQASDYVYERQQEREIGEPKLSLEEIRNYLNPEFEESYNRLALIEDDDSNEVLCYEIGGRINGSQYRLYLNAEDGSEEAVEDLKPAQLQ